MNDKIKKLFEMKSFQEIINMYEDSIMMNNNIKFIEFQSETIYAILFSFLVNNRFDDIDFLVITRGKKLDQEILQSLGEFNINTFSTAYTSFEASGILYTNGIKATDVDKEILS